MSLGDLSSEGQMTYIIITVFNSLSIISCMLILLIYLIAKDLRVYAFKLVTYLSIVDILKSMSMLIPTYEVLSSDTLCQVQSILYQFFALLSFFMTLVMSVSLYLCVVHQCEKVEKFHLLSVSSAIILSAVFTVPGVFFSIYGRSNQ